MTPIIIKAASVTERETSESLINKMKEYMKTCIEKEESTAMSSVTSELDYYFSIPEKLE
jgi:hypothetical protein